MSYIAIIPARGGSKRIPHKNIKYFCGKPIIAWSIQTALSSKLFDRVIVSTDDDDIAEIALEWGAEVPFLRPKELSDDYCDIGKVIAHTTQWLLNQNREIRAICCMYATAPFICKEDLKEGLAVFEKDSWQYVFSATTFSSPIFRSFKKSRNGSLEMIFPEYFDTRSQDLPVSLHDAGQFYWGKPDAWLKRKRVFDATSTIIQIPRWRVLDIDTQEDWEYAESMASYLGLCNMHTK